METLIPDFERATGHIVEVVFDIINAIAGRVREGQSFDLAMESPAQWEALAAERKIDPSSSQHCGGEVGPLCEKGGSEAEHRHG